MTPRLRPPALAALLVLACGCPEPPGGPGEGGPSQGRGGRTSPGAASDPPPATSG